MAWGKLSSRVFDLLLLASPSPACPSVLSCKLFKRRRTSTAGDREGCSSPSASVHFVSCASPFSRFGGACQSFLRAHRVLLVARQKQPFILQSIATLLFIFSEPSSKLWPICQRERISRQRSAFRRVWERLTLSRSSTAQACNSTIGTLQAASNRAATSGGLFSCDLGFI